MSTQCRTAGNPRLVVGRLHALFTMPIQDAEVRTRIAGFGFEPIGNTPRGFGAFVTLCPK